jgi:hypothetical protein
MAGSRRGKPMLRLIGRRRWWIGLMTTVLLAGTSLAWLWYAVSGSQYDARPVLGLDRKGNLFRTSSPVPLLPRLRMVEHVTSRGPRSVWFEYDTSEPERPAAAPGR